MSEGGLTIFVCVACQRPRADLPEGFDRPGLALAEALRERVAASGSTIPVEPVDCLAVCNRPCTVAFAAGGKWTYLIGDLDSDTHTDEILSAATHYAASENGIVAWKDRPASFRKGVVARGAPQPGPPQQG
jgi:predicted metal-binding protein